MSEKEPSAEEQLSAAVWGTVQRVVMALIVFGSGLFAGYYKWGDAIELRQTIKERQDEIVTLRNDRETISTRLARAEQDKKLAVRDLRECKDAAKAEAVPAP